MNIIITVNLPGTLQGNIKHIDRVKNVVKGEDTTYVKTILHTDRKINPCTRVTNISEHVATQWINECPDWERPHVWRKLTPVQRISSHVKSFDEGFGTSFTIVDN